MSHVMSHTRGGRAPVPHTSGAMREEKGNIKNCLWVGGRAVVKLVASALASPFIVAGLALAQIGILFCGLGAGLHISGSYQTGVQLNDAVVDFLKGQQSHGLANFPSCIAAHVTALPLILCSTKCDIIPYNFATNRNHF